MSEIEIGLPYATRALPQSIAHGHMWSGDVCTIHGSKKRKRAEVALAVDGECVNIYDVQTAGIVASYPVPPSKFFTARPCSIVRNVKKRRIAQRLTYAAVLTSGSGNVGLSCFSEDLDSGVEKNFDHRNSEGTFVSSSKTSTIVTVDVIPSKALQSQDALGDVLAVHDSGQVECISGDLKELRWERHLTSVLSTDELASLGDEIEVEYAALTDSHKVRRSLLRDRGDIMSLVQPAEDRDKKAADAVPLLFLVACSKGSSGRNTSNRKAYLFSIRPVSAGLAMTRRPGLQELLSWRLSDTPKNASSQSDESESTSQFSFHSSSGSLYCLSSGSLVSYDLSGAVASIRSNLRPLDGPFTSYLVLSSALVFAASSSGCGVYDTKFNSLQAFLPLESRNGTSQSRNCKRPHDDAWQGPVQLLNYLPDIDVVIGASEKELGAIRIQHRDQGLKRRKMENRSLLQSIGKGVSVEVKPSGPFSIEKWLSRIVEDTLGSQAVTDPDWTTTSQKLDAMVMPGDVQGFEELFLESLGIKRLEGTGLARHEAGSIRGDTEQERRRKGEDDLQRQALNGVVAVDPRTNRNDMQRNSGIAQDQQVLSLSGVAFSRPKLILHLERRASLYALTKIFLRISEVDDGPNFVLHSAFHRPSSIAIEFFPHTVFQWLSSTGNLSAAMIERAFRESADEDGTSHNRVTPRDLVASFFNFDPELRLLHSFLHQAPYLEISGLVEAIKIICESTKATSTGTSNEHSKNRKHLLTNGDIDESVLVAEEAASDELDLAFATLEEGLYLREQALQRALVRLHAFPASHIVQSLKDNLSREDILFLLNVLRSTIEESMGSLTYIQPTHGDRSRDPPDGTSVAMTVNLINCALDAAGSGGVMTGVSAPYDETVHDFINTLKDESSWAVESMHEAVYLKGLLDDFLRFTETAARASVPMSSARMSAFGRANKEEIVVSQYEDVSILPLGMNLTENRVSQNRRRASGAIQKRSARDKGMRISRTVGRYSLERIRV